MDWLSKPAALMKIRSEMLMKLFFGSFTSQKVNLGHIRRFREDQLALQGVYMGIEKMIRENLMGNPNVPYYLMTITFGIRMNKALIEWCGEAEGILQEVRENERKK